MVSFDRLKLQSTVKHYNLKWKATFVSTLCAFTRDVNKVEDMCLLAIYHKMMCTCISIKLMVMLIMTVSFFYLLDMMSDIQNYKQTLPNCVKHLLMALYQSYHFQVTIYHPQRLRYQNSNCTRDFPWEQFFLQPSHNYITASRHKRIWLRLYISCSSYLWWNSIRKDQGNRVKEREREIERGEGAKERKREVREHGKEIWGGRVVREHGRRRERDTGRREEERQTESK